MRKKIIFAGFSVVALATIYLFCVVRGRALSEGAYAMETELAKMRLAFDDSTTANLSHFPDSVVYAFAGRLGNDTVLNFIDKHVKQWSYFFHYQQLLENRIKTTDMIMNNDHRLINWLSWVSMLLLVLNLSFWIYEDRKIK